MASESSGSSRVVLAVAALAVGVVIGVLARGGGSGGGGGTTFTCDTPGDHIVTVYPSKLSCDSVSIPPNATTNSVMWQASDRTRVLEIVFDKPAPFTVDCSGFACAAGPISPNIPPGTYTYKVSSKLPGPPPPDPRTPTPTPGVLNGRVIIVKP